MRTGRMIEKRDTFSFRIFEVEMEYQFSAMRGSNLCFFA